MLLLREHTIDEIDKIMSILKKEGIEDLNLDGIVYVVLDDNDLVGVGKVRLRDEKWTLEYLIIREDKRNQSLGDALLRAILNKLFNQGIENVYYRTNSTYLIKKGFILGGNQLELNIPEFFNKGCKGCGGRNELQ
ncbi:GNAT family N-acetyltransferase [Tissierella carlieri]|uniref:GNAT family N-acetyltransferase n=1 Tax=Tissierella carlieri TaxID=689904 RepID=A0ABT1S5E6_9FIRM|nr:GNAT family N-acetyltransferase [Tissierella carlieri]MBU5311081.1 GNAT family N-acetyltransferase [Tissierella carlieri]MCQ4921674.1 GNAT family N-acetyltransferase [Tissierella carlieri]